MRKIIQAIILQILINLIVLSNFSYATHSITPWMNNHSGALSLTFDDGYASQISNAVPLLNERNIRATFFIITGESWFSGHGLNWEQWRNIAEKGHEIGSHTVSHPYLTQLSENDLREELSLSQKMINLNIPSQSCISFCYPSNEYNEKIIRIVGDYFAAARKGGGLLNGYDNLKPLLIEGYSVSLLHDYLSCSDKESLIDDNIDCLIETIKRLNKWCVLYWHQLLDEDKNDFAQILKSLTDQDIWIDTFGTIARYMIENLSSTITVLPESNSKYGISVTHALDQSIYNVPLTVRSSVPQSWSEIKIIQDNNVQIVEPVMESESTIVYYNVIPNAGLIQLSPINPLPPIISKTPEALSASSSQGSSPSEQAFRVWNSGGENLAFSISVNEEWLSCRPEQGSSTGEEVIISITFLTSSLLPGTYNANINIISDAAQNSPQTITVNLKINVNPEDEDRDGDGFSENLGDCDDTDNSIFPSAIDICGDGIDQDCDGSDLKCTLDPLDVDNDGDGFSENNGDCDDTNYSVNPAANELCGDGIDQDCDGIDEACDNKDVSNEGGGCFITETLL